jgi:hypothetical protein
MKRTYLLLGLCALLGCAKHPASTQAHALFSQQDSWEDSVFSTSLASGDTLTYSLYSKDFDMVSIPHYTETVTVCLDTVLSLNTNWKIVATVTDDKWQTFPDSFHSVQTSTDSCIVTDGIFTKNIDFLGRGVFYSFQQILGSLSSQYPDSQCRKTDTVISLFNSSEACKYYQGSDFIFGGGSADFLTYSKAKRILISFASTSSYVPHSLRNALGCDLISLKHRTP